MRFALALTCAFLLLPCAAQAELGQAHKVGPWNVAPYFENGKFLHCIMARPETDDTIGAALTRGKDYLAIVLFSKKWKLDQDASYPVTVVAGSASEQAQAAVTDPTTVAINLAGHDAFIGRLKHADSLEIRTPSTTLQVPFEQGSAALAEVEQCYADQEQKIASNPFAAPKAKSSSGGNENVSADEGAKSPAATRGTASPSTAQSLPHDVSLDDFSKEMKDIFGNSVKVESAGGGNLKAIYGNGTQTLFSNVDLEGSFDESIDKFTQAALGKCKSKPQKSEGESSKFGSIAIRRYSASCAMGGTVYFSFIFVSDNSRFQVYSTIAPQSNMAKASQESDKIYQSLVKKYEG